MIFYGPFKSLDGMVSELSELILVILECLNQILYHDRVSQKLGF